jgi:hypothetical protein
VRLGAKRFRDVAPQRMMDNPDKEVESLNFGGIADSTLPLPGTRDILFNTTNWVSYPPRVCEAVLLFNARMCSAPRRFRLSCELCSSAHKECNATPKEARPRWDQVEDAPLGFDLKRPR